MKKFFSFLTLTLLLLGSMTVSTIAADNANYRETSSETYDLARNVTYKHILAETQTDRPNGWADGTTTGEAKSVTIQIGKWYTQQVNIINVPRGTDTKVIPWSIQSNMAWKLSYVTEMAADYEAKNPGWKVLGGINGDFYDWHYTKDYPCSGSGMEVVEGNVLRYAKAYDGAVGIMNNDDSQQLVIANQSEIGRTATPVLSIYDANNQIIKKINLNKINSEISDGETGVYFGRVTGDMGINSYGDWGYLTRTYVAPNVGSGNVYLVKDADKVIFQANENSYYGIGTITSINESKDVDGNSFAVVSKNADVQNALSVGTKIRVQYELTGKLANIDNAMGVYFVLANNRKISDFKEDTYVKERMPRTLLAQKADGTISLVSIDGRQSVTHGWYGMNQQEINGLIEAERFSSCVMVDGGGSSTFFVRENDKFVVKNSPSDSKTSETPRNVGNCFLVVTKDDSFKVSGSTATANSVTLNLDATNLASNITAVKCRLNNTTKAFEDGKVTFTKLNANTEYSYELFYDQGTTKNITSFQKGVVATSKNAPDDFSVSASYANNKVNFTWEYDDPDTTLKSIKITIGNNVYTVENLTNKSLSVDVWEATSPVQKYNLIYTYDINDGLGDIEVTLENSVTLPSEVLKKEETPKKGCKKSAAATIISLISLVSMFFMIRKKH